MLEVDAGGTDSRSEAVDPPDRGAAWTFLGSHPIVFGVPVLVLGVALLTVGLHRPADEPAVKYTLVAGGALAAYVGAKVLDLSRSNRTFDLGVALSACWLALITLVAILADWLPFKEARDVSKTLTEPTRQRPDLLSAHPFGTDDNGLDILGGVAYGARVSLTVGLGATALAIVVGTAIGVCAGYFRGRLDAVVSVVTDASLAFPPLILLLAMVAVLDPSIRNVTIALAIITTPTFIRLARANTLVFAQREFVLASRALGERARSIIVRDVLPNVMLPVLSFGFLVIALLIVAEASLSFLGLSVPRPTPTWGNMIAAGQSRFDDHPHAVFLPGGVLFLTVFAFNRIGEWARARWGAVEAKL